MQSGLSKTPKKYRHNKFWLTVCNQEKDRKMKNVTAINSYTVSMQNIKL